jgi:N-dimethylarginine dimethylaminohydrolase
MSKRKAVSEKTLTEAQNILQKIPKILGNKNILNAKIKKEEVSKDMMKLDYVQAAPTLNALPYVDYPIFLMNMPLSLNNDCPNNAWVTGEVTGKKAENIVLGKALSEFVDFYSVLTQFGIVYLLPSTGKFQDLYYVANMGVALEPTETGTTFILSNFRSTPRVNEDVVGRQFLSSMNFNCVQSPYFFEGRADCHRLKPKTYIVGYNIRTDYKFHKWFKNNFDVEVISVKMTEDALYHLDCNIFVINEENILACTELLQRKDLRALEKHANVIPISIEDAFSGSCNSIQTGSAILNASLLSTLDSKSKYYGDEVKRINRLNAICSELGYELIMVDISEATKSGALASCCVCPLNYTVYDSKF